MTLGTTDRSFATVATETPDRVQRQVVRGLCLAATVLTIALLPFARETIVAIPGFLLINQTALLIAYGLSAWILFGQFRRGRFMPLLLIATGALYCSVIILLQMMSFPNILAAGRLFGQGPETTTWLWTFWHLGPPVFALAYIARRNADVSRPMSEHARRAASFKGVALAVGLAAGAGAVSTLALPWLPQQVAGDDYTALVTSGVAPAVEVLTCIAALVVWRQTQARRTVMELWILASLVLLILDNILTMAGGARNTVGWCVGRIEATVSAFAILWAYLHEMDALRARAEAAAHDIQRAESALRQAQKMEAIGRLTGGVAHDFNNLLMIVGSSFDLIRRRPDDRERVLRSADTGLDAVERGAHLTRQLLTFARRQTLRPEPADINDALAGFERLARRAVGESVELVLDLRTGLGRTRIDRNEFDVAILNLVINARDALPAQNGRIVIATSDAARDEPFVIGGETLPPGEYVRVSVTDNGAGMDENTRLQAVEPFFTTKEFGKGSGLGLSQVYGFARAMGGALGIQSSLGRGTSIDLWLPASADTKPSLAKTAATASARSSTPSIAMSETVLVVEDEPDVRAAVVDMIKDLGYRVVVASNATSALDILRSKGRVHILFSDIVMPGGMNGVQLAWEATQLRPDLRVLLSSGYPNEALRESHGVTADLPILHKPYRPGELAEHLQIARAPALAVRMAGG